MEMDNGVAKRQNTILERLQSVEKITLALECSYRSAGEVEKVHGKGLIERQEAILSRIDAIEASLTELCSKINPVLQEQKKNIHTNGNSINAGISATKSGVQLKLEQILINGGVRDFSFVRVPGDYYQKSYEIRRDLLNAASVEHLCKSIVMVNTQASQDIVDCSNPKNSKYYVVVSQYAAKFNAEKVKNFIYSLNDGKIPKKRFNMRLAPEPVSDELTGYQHNAVTPIGMRTYIPVILSEAIVNLKPNFFWLGGGEVDLKLGINTEQFIKLVKPFILDCS